MSQDPYTSPMTGPQGPYGTPPKKKSMTWLWILLGVLGGGAVLACACCGGTSYWGMTAGALIVAKTLEGNAVIDEHIGTIDSASFDFQATGEAGQKAGGDQKILVFDVKGSKGSGRVEGRQGPDGRFESGTLTTSQGTFDLFPPEGIAP